MAQSSPDGFLEFFRSRRPRVARTQRAKWFSGTIVIGSNSPCHVRVSTLQRLADGLDVARGLGYPQVAMRRVLMFWTALACPSCSLSLEFDECEVDEHCSDPDAVCSAGTCRSPRVDEGVVLVESDITEDTTWNGSNVYVLTDTIFVEPGVSLTVQAGTTVRGRRGSALVVRAGGRLFSRGTQPQPVVFTSDAPEGSRLPGDWGGVALLGEAPTNAEDPVLEGVEQRDRVGYGGDDPESSCGVLEYTRIEFAGFPLQRDEELNGLTLAGCGRGTLVDHVQVHFGLDDGVELFGGTVDLRHVVVTRAQDDSIDWDQGWTGSAQFVAIAQDAEGDNGIEASSSGDEDASPRSAPEIWNITLLGSGTDGSQRAITFKEGTGGKIFNGLVVGHPLEAIDIRDSSTVTQLQSGLLSVEHTMFFGVGPGGDRWFPTPEDETEQEPDDGRDDDEGFDEAAFFLEGDFDLVFGVNPNLTGAFNVSDPGWVPQGTTVLDAGTTPGRPLFDGFDEQADYAGAFAPGRSPWTEGWTAYPED